MTASIVRETLDKKWVGTAEEILALDVESGAKINDIAYAYDTGAEYIALDVTHLAPVWILTRASTGGAVNVTQSTHIPGARNETSTTLDYMRSVPVCTATRADIGTTETLITANPAILLGIVGNASNTGTLTILDAAATGTGATAVMIVTIGDGVTPLNTHGAYFANGITVDGSDAACDVTVFWLPA